MAYRWDLVDIKGDYPLYLDTETCYRKVQANPFSVDFDRQADVCQSLYGDVRIRMWFTMKDVEQILKEFRGIYEERVLERVWDVMRLQIRKYFYLFA